MIIRTVIVGKYSWRLLVLTLYDIVIALLLFFLITDIGPKEEVHLPLEAPTEVNEGM